MARVTLRGRGAEMSVILSVLRQAARTGKGVVVPLVGEPGIGKTSLVRDAAEQARRQGFVAGVGKTEEIDQIAPGAPLLVALRSGAEPLLDADMFAGLAPLYDRQLWLVDRIAELLAEQAARRPLLIGIDDVQWADPLTRFALRVLPSRLAGSPVVWLLTSRLAAGDRLEEIVAAVDPAVPVTRVSLGPIAVADIDALATDRLGVAPDESVRRLLRGVGGNPFWAVQLLTGLARRRARGLPETGLHAELISGIRQRMAELPGSVVAVLQAVAVCGRPVAAGAVAGLLGDSTAGLVYEAAVHAQDEGLLTVEEEGLSLPHDLIREAVYAHIPQDARRRLHRARGRQLTTALSAVPHFLASAEPDDPDAAEVALAAAAESAALMQQQAATLARKAFALHGVLEIGERALAILVAVQRNSDVLELADTLLPIARTPEEVARIEVSAGRALWEAGAGRDLARRMSVALARPGIPELEKGRLLALRALASTRTAEAPHAAAAATAALAEGNRLGDVLTQQIALHALTEATRNVGEHQKVLDYFDRLREVSPDAYIAERVRALQHLDRYAEAEAVLAGVRHDADDNLDRLLPSYLFAQAWQHHNLGELEAAETVARKLLRQAEAIENYAYVMNARIILCALAVYRGELGAAREVLAPIEHTAESRELLRASRQVLMRSWLAAAEGDAGQALRIGGVLLAAADDGSHAWAWSPAWMRVFAGIARQAGDEGAARQAAHIAELGARRNPGVATMEGVDLQVKGYLAADAELLGRAVAVLRRSPRRMLLAGALRDLGDVLDDGRAPLLEAHAVYEGAGAHGYARAIEEAHPALGLRRRARAETGWAALTETEARVAELIVAGHTNRSAATALGISANTVSTHLRSIFTKFGVRSRVQLTNAVRESQSPS